MGANSSHVSAFRLCHDLPVKSALERRAGRSSLGRSAVLVGVVLLGTVGCSDPEDVEGVATYESFGSGSDGALLEGHLELEADCVYVITEDNTFLPVFPVDEVERSDNDLTYGGQLLSDGDGIALGGGAATLGSWATLPEGCDEPEGEVWLVGQSD